MFITKIFAGGTSNFFKEDLYNSLLASFTVEEIKAQLNEEGLSGLSVSVYSDAYIMIHGEIGN